MSFSLEADFKSENLRRFVTDTLELLKQVKDGEQKYLSLVGAIVYRDVIDHFNKEAGPEGQWTKWSDSYFNHMQKIGRSGNKILQFSGNLRNYFKPQKYDKSGGGLLWYNDAKTKSGFPYAAAHNNDEARRTLPQREFMWLSEKAMDDISVATLNFLTDEGING